MPLPSYKNLVFFKDRRVVKDRRILSDRRSANLGHTSVSADGQIFVLAERRVSTDRRVLKDRRMIKKSFIDPEIRPIFYGFIQKVILILANFVFRIFAKIEISGAEFAKRIKQGPILIIANHKSVLDPVLIGFCLPYFSNIFPIRFMAKDEFFKNAFKKVFFNALGAFPAKRGQGIENSLALPSGFLSQGKTVAIFPEGRCIKHEGLESPQKGAGRLAIDFPMAIILPIAIKGTLGFNFFNIFYRRPKIKISIGCPFFSKDRISGNEQEASDQLMNEISNLYS